jgi:thioesterase domain-containing protein/acyl carrier protein
MIPVAFEIADRLPRTPGGKVDRAALPPVRRDPPPRESAGDSPAPPSPHTPTETALAAIWRDLLGKERVDLGDGFFELGGDSLQAVDLMLRIESEFGRRLPVSALIEHETVRGLAARIDAAEAAADPGLVVRLRGSGDLPPIFLFPGSGGNPLELRHLVGNLETGHPLFGLEKVDFRDAAGEIRSLEAVAESYADEMRSARPRGPYILVGYSFGGHLAIETARRLEARGETVPLVVLIDTLAYGPDRGLTRTERLRAHFDTLRRLRTPRQTSEYLRQLRVRAAMRLARFKATRGLGVRMFGPETSAIELALATQAPRPYSGRVVLFCADATPAWNVDAWRERLSGELKVLTLPGDHTGLMREPYVAELAHRLREVLESAVAG